MVQKARLPINWLLLATVYCGFLVAISSCHKKNAEKNYAIDTTVIPKDTLNMHNPKMSFVNGLYYLEGKKYSGILAQSYPNGNPKSYSSIWEGMLHGAYRSFYENGKPFEVRHYKNNLSTGRHYGYWAESGKMKFDFNYYEEKREGTQKKWYKSGKPLVFMHCENDHEVGLQQAWRENGKLYVNYVAKDGHIYGLQQTELCYKLINQEVE